MQLEDLKVGEEYYTANDHSWATGQPGGRMRLMSGKPVDAYTGKPGPAMHCVQLAPGTGRVLDFRSGSAEVFLNCFRGTWAEVGAPLHAQHQQWTAWAEEVDAHYRAALELAVGTLRDLGMPAATIESRGQCYIEVTPVYPAMLGGLFTTKE